MAVGRADFVLLIRAVYVHIAFVGIHIASEIYSGLQAAKAHYSGSNKIARALLRGLLGYRTHGDPRLKNRVDRHSRADFAVYFVKSQRSSE